MNPSTTEIVATVLFGLAIIHTFMVKKVEQIAHKYPTGSVGENFFSYSINKAVITIRSDCFYQALWPVSC